MASTRKAFVAGLLVAAALVAPALAHADPVNGSLFFVSRRLRRGMRSPRMCR